MRKRMISMAAALIMLITAVCMPVNAEKRYKFTWDTLISSVTGGTQSEYNPAEYLFKPILEDGSVSVEQFSILDDSDPAANGFFVLAAKEYGLKPWYTAANSDTTKMNANDSNCIMYYLNTTLLNNTEGYTFDSGIQKYLKTVNWQTEDRVDEYNYFEAKLSLLSVEEYVKYYKKFGRKMLNYNGDLDYFGFWKMRTPIGNSASYRMVGVNGNSGYFVALSWADETLYRARPCFYLDRDYFKNQKIDLASAGSAVISMLKSEYTRDELAGAGYSEDDLNNLFPPAAETITAVSISGEARPGKTLTADITTASGNKGYYDYQWMAADTADGAYTQVSTDAAYVITNAVGEKYIKVIVTARGEGGNSMESAPVLAAKALAVAAWGEALPTYDGAAAASYADPAAYKFYPENSSDGFSVLDADSEGNVFILAGDAYGQVDHGPAKISLTDSSSVGYYLNTTLLARETSTQTEKALNSGIKEHLQERSWLSNGLDNDYEFTAKLSSLSYAEYLQYYTKFGPKIGGVNSWWRLRSVSGSGNGQVVTASGDAITIGTGTGVVRPCFWLDRDYFKTNRIQLDLSGSDVLRHIRATYPRAELEAMRLYSASELDTIYASGETATATDVKIHGVAAVGQTLRGGYTYTSSSGAAESGTQYAWYRSQDGTSYTKIDGATDIEYTVTEADLGKTLRFGVTVRTADGSLTDEVLSAATSAVTAQKAITVTFKELQNAAGEKVTSVLGQTTLKAVFTVENITSENKSVSLALATYTGSNQMVDCEVTDVTVTPGTAEYSVTLTALNITSGNRVRAMSFADMVNIIPLCGYETTAQ